ncbi:cell wall hydrolase [Loktanella sp. R86503]|uniref:cell wall hydrolase n=1 Tax=Loktanella sp. R86503 TaxID=3093847 RepID=UPI0036D93512
MTNPLHRALIAAITLASVSIAAPASAEEVMTARLGAVLGQERQALQIVPDTRLAALTAVPESARRNAMPADGDAVMTEAYLSTMTTPKGNSEWECLADALYFEARGESLQGIFAVGEVILNRVDSAEYPNTICGVVHQGTGKKFACQFTWTCDNNSDAIGNAAAFGRVGKVAKLLVDGLPRRLTAGATHYHTKAVHPSWANRFPRTASIGAHHFYKQSTRSASN